MFAFDLCDCSGLAHGKVNAITIACNVTRLPAIIVGAPLVPADPTMWGLAPSEKVGQGYIWKLDQFKLVTVTCS